MSPVNTGSPCSHWLVRPWQRSTTTPPVISNFHLPLVSSVPLPGVCVCVCVCAKRMNDHFTLTLKASWRLDGSEIHFSKPELSHIKASSHRCSGSKPAVRENGQFFKNQISLVPGKKSSEGQVGKKRARFQPTDAKVDVRLEKYMNPPHVDKILFILVSGI